MEEDFYHNGKKKKKTSFLKKRKKLAKMITFKMSLSQEWLSKTTTVNDFRPFYGAAKVGGECGLRYKISCP